METNFTRPVEFIIPRDSNFISPPIFLQNITNITDSDVLFNYHFVRLVQTNPELTYAMHLELLPINFNLSYLLIYRFDQQPKSDSLENWTLFCSKGNEDLRVEKEKFEVI